MKPNISQLGFSIAALLIFLQACVPAPSQQPPEPIPLQVVTSPFLSHAPFYIAQEEGYFAEQGLEVEFVRLGSDEAIPALLRGEVDVWAGIISVGLLNALGQDVPIKLVAGRGYHAASGCTYTALMTRQELLESGELDDPDKLRGRPISVELVDLGGYLLEKYIEPLGLTPDDFEIVGIDDPAVRAESLAQGAVDIIDNSEPWITRIVQAGQGVPWVRAEVVIPDFPLGFIMYGQNLLEENPEAGRRFMVAYLKAIRQYNEGKTERNLEILVEVTGLERELLEAACWVPFREDGEIDIQSVLDFQDWALEKGYLDGPVPVEQFWDPSFIEYADQVLSTSGE